MASNTKLKVYVLAAKNLMGKNGGKSDPYCEVTVLDDQGNKIGKGQCTKVLKSELNPQWNQLLEFTGLGSNFSGLKLCCWDKHKFRSDKFLGQVTIKFNTGLLQSTEKVDDWFSLKKRKSGEEVSGDVHLQVFYGDLKETATTTPTKDRSSTVTEANTTYDLKVSASFSSEETKNKLKNSTHVVVDEEVDEDDTREEEFDKVREGPSTACLEKLLKDEKDLAFSNKNLEVTNNTTDYYKLSYAKGNVSVNGGKWYFEVRIQYTGTMQIGWCTLNYNSKSTTGDIWSFDGSRQQKIRNTTTSSYGEYWSTGDLIGVALDVDSKTIQFWRNGKDLGVAFNDVSPSGSRLVPVIGLGRRVKVQVNFGKDNYAFPQLGFNPLHCFLSEKEIEQLSKLFNKYKELGNQGLIDEWKSRPDADGSSPELKDSIHGNGLLEFQQDLGIVDDEDPTLMIIAWKLKSETLWELSREEFMNGFTVAACASIDKIKSKAREWRDELKDTALFRSFYNFVFDYLKEDKKILLTEEAIMAWKIVLKERPWGLFNDFVEFLQAEDKKSISRDAWQQLWHFMTAYPKSLKDYDTNSSWPIIYDEFVEWMEAKGRKNK